MTATTPLHKRPVAIASAVVLLHVGGLAALQSGLIVRAYEMVVPVEMISQIIEPPKPMAPPPAPTPPPPPEPVKVNKAVPLPTAPQPLAIADPTPAPNAPVATPAPPAPLPPITAPLAATPSPAPAAPPAPAPAPKVELPRADADYLNNPKPPYPPVSKRLAEQGRVMVRVYVGADGSAQKVELNKSSGFDRLDATAVATVARWRFKPGTRGGVPEAMWHLIPIDFVLDN
ncbi:MAG: energy transducer TonB [Burkholderiales bacterium]|nr:MAG: energy transducer TonB [Burkholderiales bacterium]